MSLKISLEDVQDDKAVAEVTLCGRLTDVITTDGNAMAALTDFACQAGREFQVDVFVRGPEGELLYWWTPRDIRQ